MEFSLYSHNALDQASIHILAAKRGVYYHACYKCLQIGLDGLSCMPRPAAAVTAVIATVK